MEKFFFLIFLMCYKRLDNFIEIVIKKYMDSKIFMCIELDERKSEIVREKGVEKKWRR